MGTMSGYNKYQTAGQGLQAAGGATATVLPWVGAGLTAAGLLSQLYGGYQADKVAKKNYLDQLREYEEEKQLMAEETRRREAQQEMQNQYTAKGAADTDMNGRLARYSQYFRQVGY